MDATWKASVYQVCGLQILPEILQAGRHNANGWHSAGLSTETFQLGIILYRALRWTFPDISMQTLFTGEHPSDGEAVQTRTWM